MSAVSRIRGMIAEIAFGAGLVCLSPILLNASPLACPTTVIDNAAFPSGTYVCLETDNVWLSFADLGAVTSGMSALPDGTIFHIDTVVPGEVSITIEPTLENQFAAGATYSWTYEVVEDSLSNPFISGASADYGAEGTSPSFVTTLTEVDVSGYNPDGTPIATLGTAGALGSLTNTTGALEQTGFAPVSGAIFTDTLTGIGNDTTIQSISNDIQEAPEPLPEWLLGLGLMACGLQARRRVALA